MTNTAPLMCFFPLTLVSLHVTTRDAFGSFPLIRYYCPDPLPHAATDTSPWLITKMKAKDLHEALC